MQDYANTICRNLLSITEGNDVRAYAWGVTLVRNELMSALADRDAFRAERLTAVLGVLTSRLMAAKELREPIRYTLTPAGDRAARERGL